MFPPPSLLSLFQPIPSPISSFLYHPSHLQRLRHTQTLIGHAGCVNNIIFNDSTTHLLSCSDDLTLRLYPLSTLTPCPPITPPHSNNIFSACFLRNDSVIASAGFDAQICAMDVHTNIPIFHRRHDDAIKALSCVEPNVFVSASIDGTAKSWDLRTPNGDEQTIVRTRAVYCVKSKPTDQNYLLVAVDEPALRIYDLRMRRCIEMLRTNGNIVGEGTSRTYATYADWGKHSVVGSFYDELVHVWDMKNSFPARTGTTMKRETGWKRKRIEGWIGEALIAFENEDWQGTVGWAGRVLGIDETNLLARMLLAEGYKQRAKSGDAMRSVAEWLRVQKDMRGRVRELWGRDESGQWRVEHSEGDREKLWLNVVSYKVIDAMWSTLSLGLWAPLGTDLLQANEEKRRMWQIFETIKKVDIPTDMGRTWWTMRAKLTGSASELEGMYSGVEGPSKRAFLDCLFSEYHDEAQVISDRVSDHMEQIERNIRRAQQRELRERRIRENSWAPLHVSHALNRSANVVLPRATVVLDVVRRDMDYPEEFCAPRKRRKERVFAGHKSTKTDIKQARMCGEDDQMVVGGSDDKCMYMWEKETGFLIGRVIADSRIVNCVLPHPHETLIFASGIDSTIKVLTPTGANREEQQGATREPSSSDSWI